MCKSIFITGTPCTGKTTVSEVLASRLNCKLVKINDLAIENDFVLGIDEDKGYKVIDIPALNEKVSEIIDGSDEMTVFEGHLAHLCDGADKIIVLEHGKIVESGNHSELMNLKGWYYDQYNAQMMNGGEDNAASLHIQQFAQMLTIFCVFRCLTEQQL